MTNIVIPWPQSRVSISRITPACDAVSDGLGIRGPALTVPVWPGARTLSLSAGSTSGRMITAAGCRR